MVTFIIVPCYNEESKLKSTVQNIIQYVPAGHVLIIDDGSVDDTLSIAQSTGCQVLELVINLGKGAAMRAGCDYAVELGADKIICIDADGQHDPKHIPQIEQALDNVEMVYLYRSYDNKMPFVLRFGNSFIRFVGSLVYHTNIKDPQSGYRGFTADAYHKIRWSSPGYFVENEMIYNMNLNNLTYTELPIETIYSDKYKGTGILDGMKIVLNLLWLRLSGSKKNV